VCRSLEFVNESKGLATRLYDKFYFVVGRGKFYKNAEEK